MAGGTGRLVPHPAPSPAPEQTKGPGSRVGARGGRAGRASARAPGTQWEVGLASPLTSGLVNVQGVQQGPSPSPPPQSGTGQELSPGRVGGGALRGRSGGARGAWGEQQPPLNWQGASCWMALVFSASLPTPESPPPPMLCPSSSPPGSSLLSLAHLQLLTQWSDCRGRGTKGDGLILILSAQNLP